ncbi:MAG TPA: ASKHA domain-containing protein [Lachnospiraceae bacterium]|nr:ASKHA domain-containing protein [Lachnospiraceae bacterium]
MKTYTIQCETGESLLTALRKQHIKIAAACSGRASCGSCKIRLQSGTIQAGEADRQFFSEKELADGWRLACTSYPQGSCTIEIPDIEQNKGAILTAYTEQPASIKNEEAPADFLFAAIDLGTTTIAAQLIKGNKILKTAACLNSQCSYGADVISRCEVSQHGDGSILKEAVTNDIRTLLGELASAAGGRKIRRLIIAGNTVMVHLFMGYSCKGLTDFPFTPVTLEQIDGELDKIPFTLFPGISTYVGGDITAGLFSCGFHKSEKVSLFVDLGTNGEMAIGNKEKIICTSAAAGPAFEESKLSRATDVVLAMAGLLNKGIIDETGLLADPYFDSGYPYEINGSTILISQKDIRNFQMAKAAVRAGITLLIQNYGAAYEAIDTLFLAGGMGHSLDIDAAVKLGLLPKELKKRAVFSGNCSLKGTVLYGQNKCPKSLLDRIVSISTEINLANEPDFQQLYFDHMSF